MRRYDQITALPESDRIAIRCSARGKVQTELPGCTGAVVDDDLLSKVLSQFLPDQAREYVGRITGRERDNDTYRPVWIRLWLRRSNENQRKHDSEQDFDGFHDHSSPH
jgi:hypothetical protein